MKQSVAHKFRLKTLGILWFLMAAFVMQPVVGAWHISGHEPHADHACAAPHDADDAPMPGDSHDVEHEDCGLCLAFAAAATATLSFHDVPSWQPLTILTGSFSKGEVALVSHQRLPTRARAPPFNA